MFLNFYSLYSISDVKPTDKKAYLEHMLEKQIHNQTTNIPFPYTENDSEWWISHVQKQTVEQGKSVNWAIRNSSDYLIGGIGFHNFQIGKPLV